MVGKECKRENGKTKEILYSGQTLGRRRMNGFLFGLGGEWFGYWSIRNINSTLRRISECSWRAAFLFLYPHQSKISNETIFDCDNSRIYHAYHSRNNHHNISNLGKPRCSHPLVMQPRWIYIHQRNTCKRSNQRNKSIQAIRTQSRNQANQNHQPAPKSILLPLREIIPLPW